MQSFEIALTAVIPLLIYISIGYFARIFHLAEESFMKELNKVIFRIFFVILMFNNLYKSDLVHDIPMKVLVFSIASLISLILILCLLVPRFEPENKKRGVLIQGIYRSNSLLFAIPLAESIFGAEGSAVASMLVAFAVPVYNISAVVILEAFQGKKTSFKNQLLNIIKNPLIIGAACGVAFSLSPFTMPAPLAKSISSLAGMCTPLALFVLGGTLHFSEVGKNAKYIAWVCALKLVIVPAIMVAIMHHMQLEPIHLFAGFVMHATPIATASFPMAASMGGDAELAGQLVVFTSVASIFTLFGWILILTGTGII